MKNTLTANAAAVLVALVVVVMAVLVLAHANVPGVLDELLLLLTGGALGAQIPAHTTPRVNGAHS